MNPTVHFILIDLSPPLHLLLTSNIHPEEIPASFGQF